MEKATSWTVMIHRSVMLASACAGARNSHLVTNHVLPSRLVKVRVSSDRCQGHTLCGLAAPEVFKFREDDGHAFVESEDVAPQFESAVLRAVDTCPEQAITTE
jgi:ferredoxin